jgi:hypothetical protein
MSAGKAAADLDASGFHAAAFTALGRLRQALCGNRSAEFFLCKTDALWTQPMTRPCPEVDATKVVSHRRAKVLKA